MGDEDRLLDPLLDVPDPPFGVPLSAIDHPLDPRSVHAKLEEAMRTGAEPEISWNFFVEERPAGDGLVVRVRPSHDWDLDERNPELSREQQREADFQQFMGFLGQALSGAEGSFIRFCAFLCGGRDRTFIGPALADRTEEIAARYGKEPVREFARRLIREGPAARPVEGGLYLLHVGPELRDAKPVLTVARHWQTAAAAHQLLEKMWFVTADQIWELAKTTSESPRYFATKLLAGRIENRPDIRGWISRAGVDKVYEFGLPGQAMGIGKLCAEAGRIADALAEARCEPEIIDQAARMFVAMSHAQSRTNWPPLPDLGQEGEMWPGEGLESYRDGPTALSRWIDHLERRPGGLERLEALIALRERIANMDRWPGLADEAEEFGWSREIRERLIGSKRCLNMLAGKNRFPLRSPPTRTHRWRGVAGRTSAWTYGPP